MTKVIFRKYRKGGDIIAIFPFELWNYDIIHCNSYMHMGQHGSADYNHIIDITSLATKEDYQYLYDELVNIGYNDLKVYKRAPKNALNVRREKAKLELQIRMLVEELVELKQKKRSEFIINDCKEELTVIRKRLTDLENKY